MLLENNTERVMNLVDMVDDINGIDKVRLAIHILEESNFSTNYDENFIKLLKEVLEILDPNSKKVITNFAKYKNLLFISAKYMELSLLEKQKFLVEILFNIFQYDFKNAPCRRSSRFGRADIFPCRLPTLARYSRKRRHDG